MTKPKTRAGGRWTEARYYGFIRSTLRRASLRWPPRGDAMKNNRRTYTGEDKRTKWEHQCAICAKWFKAKEIEIDHIKPCGALTCDADLTIFISRLFCEEDNLRKLCKSCHKEVTHVNRK